MSILPVNILIYTYQYNVCSNARNITRGATVICHLFLTHIQRFKHPFTHANAFTIGCFVEEGFM